MLLFSKSANRPIQNKAMRGSTLDKGLDHIWVADPPCIVANHKHAPYFFILKTCFTDKARQQIYILWLITKMLNPATCLIQALIKAKIIRTWLAAGHHLSHTNGNTGRHDIISNFSHFLGAVTAYGLGSDLQMHLWDLAI